MVSAQIPYGLLLAAHGERKENAENVDVAQLAAALSARNFVNQVAFGFIMGSPTIAEALGNFSVREIIVYPMFLSEGYFTRIRLPEILKDASLAHSGSVIRVLRPLGADPALGDIVLDRAAVVAHAHGCDCAKTTVVLLAHGSNSDTASRSSTTELSHQMIQSRRFNDVRIALLEGGPSLRDATEGIPGPIVVVGLFVGDGLHNADDAPRLIAELGRGDVVFAGLGGPTDIAPLVAAAVMRQLFEMSGDTVTTASAVAIL